VLEFTSAAPATVREAVRAEAALRNRREYERYAADHLAWLRSIRLNSETGASLVDLSATGALIETRWALRPGSRVSLTLVGPTMEETVTLSVLRCEVSRIEQGLVYRGAGKFDRAIRFPRIGGAEPQRAAPNGQPAAAAAPGAAAQAAGTRLVVRYIDGGMVKGFSHDFHPSRSHFHLSSLVGEVLGPPIFVPMEQLKAIFFVRDFDGNAGYVERRTFVGPQHGRRLEVTFLDGEVLLGATLGFRPHDPGFFLTPNDPNGNNLRVYVLRSAVRHIRYLGP
jgi:PilZ domain